MPPTLKSEKEQKVTVNEKSQTSQQESKQERILTETDQSVNTAFTTKDQKDNPAKTGEHAGQDQDKEAAGEKREPSTSHHERTLEYNKGNLQGLGRSTTQVKVTETTTREPLPDKSPVHSTGSHHPSVFIANLVRETLKELDHEL
jgi:hypothetical protein